MTRFLHRPMRFFPAPRGLALEPIMGFLLLMRDTFSNHATQLTANVFIFLETPFGDPPAYAGRVVGGFFIFGKTHGIKTCPSGSRMLCGRVLGRGFWCSIYSIGG